MLGTNKNSRRPTSSWNLSSFLINLIVLAPPSTSAEDKTHFGFLLQQLLYLLLLSLSQRFFVNAFRPLSAKPWVRRVHVRCLLLGYPDYHSAMVARIECSCAWLRLKKVAHCPNPLPTHLPCLAVYAHSMDGILILIHETRYVPYSRAKVGSTVRQLGSISCVLLDPESKHTDGLHRCQRDVLYFQSGAKERWICRWIRVCERTVAWHWGTWDWSCGFDNSEW